MTWFQTSFGERYAQLYAHRDVREAEAVVDLLYATEDLVDRRVLDLACGAGRYLAQLQARGARAVGVDLSAHLLRRARRVTRTGSLVRADMRDLPLVDGAVDITWCMFTSFGYFETEAAHRALAREMARVTRQEIILDLPDVQFVRDTLVARSERSLPGWTVEERRWLEENPLRVCKSMQWFSEASAQDAERYEERVMLFEREQIDALFHPAGFAVAGAFGDYHGADYVPGSSPRMLLQLRRDGF